MTTWLSQSIDDRHDLSQFTCGHDVLDRWLRAEALRANRAGVSRTAVWVARDDPTVVAYHAIAPTRLARIDLPSRSLSAGFTHVPGYLIGRLALHKTLHGQGLGTQLLLDALERILDAAEHAGGRVIAVDAIDTGGHRFYEHHGFRSVEGSNRLVMKVSTARAVIG